MEKKCDQVIPRKRAFGIYNDCKLEELNCSKAKEIGWKKPCFGSKLPSGKVKFLGSHLLKQGLCPKPKVTTTIVRTKKPLRNFDDIGSNSQKITSNCNDKLVDSRHLEPKKLTSDGYGRKPNVENENLKRFGPEDLSKTRTYLGSRPTRKTKYWDPICSKEVDAQNLKETITVGVSHKEQVAREKIKKAMIVFYQVYEKLYQDNASKEKGKNIGSWRVPFEAAKIVRKNLKWTDPEKTLGPICGVQVGDTFKYRAQLQMVGLHSQPLSGIDYTKINGKNLAISIVDSHRYSNESGSSDMLSYCGHGGCFLGPKLPPEDQKLERGNLALKNSMVERTPVRVIRKVEGIGKNEVFAYDGLYIVKRCKRERSLQGKIVFKFELDRIPGQPKRGAVF